MDLFQGEAAENHVSLDKIRWYAARLAAMSPPEVLHRFRELALKRAWRSDRRGWAAFSDAGAAVSLREFPVLCQRLAAGFPLAREALSDIAAGRFRGLGREWSEGLGPSLWLTDPIRNTLWPGADAYGFDIDVRSTGTARGDVKYVWEVNRLQMLHPLAAAMAADPSGPATDRALALVRSWRDANPPFRGVNWVSGIELAMRLVSLALVAIALPPARKNLENTRLFNELIAAHAFWLHRYPSRFSSANNHLVAEGLGLLVAGLVAPGLPHAKDYLSEGRAILESEAGKQIFADGVGAEQSPTYQAFTMEMLALGALFSEAAGTPLAPVVKERLTVGARFLARLMDTAGAVPHIGDDDEGRVIAIPGDREPRYVASVVAMVAGLLNDNSLLPPARDLHLRDALFAVPARAASAPDGLSHFPQGGYSVGREQILGRSCVLTLDHGPLGYLSLAAHGHADALAVWLSVDDQPVLVDAGTFLYHSGGVLRAGLRSSPAHNTLTINGSSQSRPSAAFSWASKASANADTVRDGRWWAVTASHDGYRKRFGVRHSRTVTRTPTGFDIADELLGKHAELHVELGFLIHPSLEVLHDGARYLISAAGTPLVAVVPPAGLAARIVRGDRETGAGLFSPVFGELLAASRLTFSGQAAEGPAVTRIDILAKS